MKKTLAIISLALALSLAACGGNRGGLENAAGSVRGRGSAQDAQDEQAQRRYEQMLENARVHDSDGFLLDGENSSHQTF